MTETFSVSFSYLQKHLWGETGEEQTWVPHKLQAGHVGLVPHASCGIFVCVCVCACARVCVSACTHVCTHTGPGWGWARLPGLVLPRENEKGEECELGAQSRDDTGEGAWLSPLWQRAG